ncbi:acyl-CoA dehydrogenase family protein [Polyangium aurulentum]|uniref:acyl-CoA dehydrogenase family protein n=1 Tax=Polyangium aurulentum TaxID=2567896 RepID=UPI0010AE90CE|nr:acyl-CoA dehydrogenase family protein [Polyangium aurulentum]UQA58120.1 acyl-CoA dehydrogenase family protein [Polyangium aurulentum]
MNFELSPEIADLRQEVRVFVEDRIIPNEARIVAEDREKRRTTLDKLQAAARAEGLWVPHLPAAYGGRGLGIMGMCALFREMGRSPVGAKVFNCDAPNQGNMDLLLSAGSDAMREKYLRPLAAGEITSAFCMTEPAPGAGADPSNLKTRAVKDGSSWVIHGHKWYSTGGGDAAFLIVMARTSDDPKTGATMFVVDRQAEGIEHVRDIPTMSEPLLDHREAEFKFHGVRVGEDAVLKGVGEGFRLAQQRLVPARLTHCMRWLGLADRTLAMCKQYLVSRESFGKKLAQHQMVQLKIAEHALGIHSGNLMTYHCAAMLERGLAQEARPYSSMAKLHVARLLCAVLDDAIQLHGGLGYSEDLPFSTWYRYARSARIADGPDEVHEVVIARDFFTRGLELLV